jgi:DNA-binding transcriptional regulator YiaG
MTPDQIRAIKHTTGYSWKKLAHILNINESSVRRAAHGDYVLGGSSARMLEMLERGEVPERYL